MKYVPYGLDGERIFGWSVHWSNINDVAEAVGGLNFWIVLFEDDIVEFPKFMPLAE